jgi:aspartate/methionine/tyrosine aminotransferase
LKSPLARARAWSANYGAYSHSKGGALFREKIAEFIERRDGLPASGVAFCRKIDFVVGNFH